MNMQSPVPRFPVDTEHSGALGPEPHSGQGGLWRWVGLGLLRSIFLFEFEHFNELSRWERATGEGLHLKRSPHQGFRGGFVN